jgi:hypothetical protein
MSDRPEPTVLPQRRHGDEPSLPLPTPAPDPQVLRRVAEALGDVTSPGSPTDQR